jgi:hypothetical protein
MSTTTTVLGLTKPDGTEPFARSILNDNADKMDAALIDALISGTCDGVMKGDMVFDANGNPQSQPISGPNGLTGSITWSFTSTTITETWSITAPVARTKIKTITLATLAETWVES